MSERAQSPLGGASADGVIRVEDAGLRGMITIRGDLSNAALKNAATAISGVNFPGIGEAKCVGETGIFWMSPDEIMVLCPYEDRRAAVAKATKSLGKSQSLVVDVSDARASLLLTGEASALRDTLGKLTPADLSPLALPKGVFRRTRLAQVPAGFWFRDPETVELVVFRSVAGYAFDLLRNAAAAPVGHF